jgi:hypothetical protein
VRSGNLGGQARGSCRPDQRFWECWFWNTVTCLRKWGDTGSYSSYNSRVIWREKFLTKVADHLAGKWHSARMSSSFKYRRPDVLFRNNTAQNVKQQMAVSMCSRARVRTMERPGAWMPCSSDSASVEHSLVCEWTFCWSCWYPERQLCNYTPTNWSVAALPDNLHVRGVQSDVWILSGVAVGLCSTVWSIL